MKISFQDRSYIEVSKSQQPDKVIITIVARENKNSLSTIASSVELTIEQFNELIKNIK